MTTPTIYEQIFDVAPAISPLDPFTSRQELERRIRHFVAIGSEIERSQVIPGNDGPVPDDTFVTVTLTQDEVYGTPDEWYEPNTDTPPPANAEEEEASPLQGRLLVRQSRKATYSLQWLREGIRDDSSLMLSEDFPVNKAQTGMDNFVVFAGSSLGVFLAERLGFRVQQYSDMHRVDEQISSDWEFRLAIDLDVAYFFQKVYDGIDQYDFGVPAPPPVWDGDSRDLREDRFGSLETTYDHSYQQPED